MQASRHMQAYVLTEWHLQAVFLLIFTGQALTAWGAGPASPLRSDGMSYLRIRALGAPATVVFMVAQARPC